VTTPILFTANNGLEVGSDLGSPISLDDFDEAPFRFNGTVRWTPIQGPDRPDATRGTATGGRGPGPRNADQGNSRPGHLPSLRASHGRSSPGRPGLHAAALASASGTRGRDRASPW